MRARPVAAALLLSAAVLSGCTPAPSDPSTDETEAPIGPVAPVEGGLTLASVVGIVTQDDVSATTVLTPGDTLSNSGDDLAAENDYWIGVGGTPQTCAAVVSSPYLVSGHDTDTRLDDPSALLATITEVDEDRFGLIQVYAREFDDATIAAGFLDEVTDAVERCPGYTLSAEGSISYRAVGLEVAPLDGLPETVAGVHYVETVEASTSTGVTTSFLQREGVVISVYAETTRSSTIDSEDADALAALIATRLAAL